MITLQVTSDSSLDDLNIAKGIIFQLIDRIETRNKSLINNTTTPTFNATELAEAEQLGKPVCSTVDAEASQTAQEDMTVNTSIPTPQSVFGQPAQTTANVANPVAPPTDNLVLDADGLPWDERIHSSSKEPVKDGTWRKRRGVSDELVKLVEAELRGKPVITATELAISTATQTSDIVSANLVNPTPPVVTETSPHHDVQVYANVTGKSLEQSEHDLNNGASVHSYNDGETVVINPDGGETSEMTFTELLDGVTKAMVAGQLSQQTINEALASIGLTALPHLLGNPTLIPAFRTALGGVV